MTEVMWSVAMSSAESDSGSKNGEGKQAPVVELGLGGEQIGREKKKVLFSGTGQQCIQRCEPHAIHPCPIHPPTAFVLKVIVASIHRRILRRHPSH